MEEKLLTLLEKVDKKLDKFGTIENQVCQQNDRIKHLEDSVRDILDRNDRNPRYEVEAEVVQDKQCRNENFINQMRADLQNVDSDETNLKGARSKVKKASSFQDRSTRRSLKVRRSIHTVPSDKDEERRLNSFRRECLSKAIQWNIVDILKAIPAFPSIINLPKWLSKSEMKSIRQGNEKIRQFRNFLCILIEKDFGTMQDWLKDCQLDKGVVQKVWITYEEFSDRETNRIRMKCFHCKLIETVNIADVVDYLFSAEIISIELYMRISCSEVMVGAQEGLWKEVLEECRRFIYPQALVSAFKIAITDKLNKITDSDSDDMLLDLIEEVDANDILDCHCQERCSKSLHPLSCLKSMSLAGIYFSPPTVRKNTMSSLSDIHQSSLSSVNSNDEDSKEECKQSVSYLSVDDDADDETDLKKPAIPPRVPIISNGRERSSRRKVAKVPNRSQKALQRQSKEMNKVLAEVSSSDSFDGDCRPPVVPPRHSLKTVNNMSSNRQENKPNVINAKNVYLDTGSKFYLTQRDTNKRCFSSGSSSEQL